MYKIGDKIVYPIHGAGVIADIEKKQILGEIREYYILKMPINEMRVLVPVGSMDEVGVRDIKSIDEMNEVLAVFSASDRVEMPKNWNRRFRFNQEKIKGGDLEEIANVIKNLEFLDQEKSLSTGERKLLNSARQIIVSEMVLVYDKDVDEINQMINEALKEGKHIGEGEK